MTLAALLVFSNVPAAVAASGPSVGSIVAPLDPVQVGSVINVASNFTDPDSSTFSSMWDWGDGTTSPGVVTYGGGAGAVTGSHAYGLPGVYRLELLVTDETGATGNAAFEFIVVFDPSGGFVTGGGWINSPPGAYAADPSLAGRATFGLVAKYQPGTSVPQGTTEFQFRAADFNFHSLDYDWLVVSGARAQYKGTGTIHGRDGAFRFFVTAIDGDLLGGDHPDQFRIKVFDAAGVIYDNQQGASDDADPVMALGGGSIVIHKAKVAKPVNSPPVANAGPDQTVIPGTVVTLNGSGSSDPDGDALTYAWTLLSKPAGSAAALTGATTVTPHFAADIAGVYVVQLVVNDGTVNSAPDQVSVTASAPANHAPTATDDAYTTNEDAVLTVAAPGILANDADADGDPLTAVLAVGPTHGTLTFDANGSFVYTPSLNFNGGDSFTYRVSDGTATSGLATVQINVTAVNDPPDAKDDVATTPEDTAVMVSILANDSDVDSAIDLASFIILTAPVHGTAQVVDPATLLIQYTPSADFHGTDTFTYRICDTAAACDTATVTITVVSVNDAPVANDDTYTTSEDTVLTVAAPGILTNDTDVSGDALTAVLVSGPAHGTLTLSADGSFTYTPSINFAGSDSFTYRASDGAATSAIATVQINVSGANDGPDAHDDAATTNEDTPVVIDVLANDTDADGNLDPASVSIVSAASHGATAVDPATGRVTYTPQVNFHGGDMFTYQLCDTAAACDTAVVAVTVLSVNDAPVADAGADQSAMTAEMVTLDGSGSSDPDADALTYSWAIVSAPAGSTAVLVDPTTDSPTLTPDLGGVYVIALTVSDGTVSSAPDEVQVTANTPPTVDAGLDRELAAGQTLTFTASFTDPDGGDTHTASIDWGDGTTTAGVVDETAKTITGSHLYATVGTFTVTIVVTDSHAATGSDTMTVGVGAANAAPIAMGDTYGTNEDTALTVAAPGILGNDTDADGNALTAVLVSGPAHGTLSFGADGSFTYTPDLNIFGTDSFTYRASDGTALSGPATVTINVAAVNDPPAAQDDSATTNEDVPALIDVLSNDTDVEGSLSPSAVSILVAPLHGGAAVDPATGAITYSPQVNFYGGDSFTYQVCDTAAACDTAVVAITVLPLNDPPIADAGDDQSANIGQIVTLDGSGSSDADGDVITYAWTIVSAPAGSTAVLSGATTSAPTIAPDRNGLYRFELTVSDGTAASSDQVDVTVLGAITLAPDPLNLQINSTGSLAVTLSAPAGPSGQLVDLGTNSAVVSIPSSVLVPAGATSVSFDVTTGTASGLALVTASASGFASDSATVNVAAGTLLLTLEDELVGVGRSTDGTVTLFAPAPSGGTLVTLVITNTSIATVTPATVTIAAGATQGTFFVTGVAVGVTTLTGSAPGYLPADASVTVTDALISIGNIPEIGPDETEGVPISLTKPAPPGGLTITLITTEPNIATVSPTATVAAGQFLPPANPQVTGHALGTTEIIASAPGFAPGHRNVVVALKLTFSPTSLALGANTDRDITLLLSHTAPAGGLTVQLHTDNANIATVPATATFPAGLTSVVIPVHGVASGTTTLRANATGIAEATASIVVGAPITVANQSVGKDLQQVVGSFLGVPAPAGNLTVTFTSSDPSLLRVSSSPTAAGGASATVQVQAGLSSVPAVYFQALAGAGTVTVTESALGYSDGVSTVTLTPSGFWIWAPGFAQSFTTNSFAANSTVLVSSVRLPPNLVGGAEQEIRGGLTVNVDVFSSQPGVGTITTSPIVFQGGTGARKSTEFDPQGPGVSILSIPSPVPGFSVPATLGQTVTATVVAPTVKFFNISQFTAGRDLQGAINVQLESTPPGPVDVTVSVAPGDEGIVSLTKTPTAEGASSVTFTGVTGISLLTLWVQGRSVGNAHLSASATGYNSSTIPVSIIQSGFWIWAPGFAQSFTTNSFAANSTILVSSVALPLNLVGGFEQELRGGLTVNVDVTSSNTAVGTITTSPIVFQGGTGARKSTLFDPQGAGVSILSIPSPVPGFSIPATLGQTVTATVVAPNVNFFNITQLSVGRDLQWPVNVQLESAPPAPVNVTVTVTGGSGLVTLTTTRTVEGTSSVTFTGVTSTNLLTLFVQGRTLGDVQLTATAAGYTSDTLPVTVTSAGFFMFAPSFATAFTTNTFAAPTSIFVRAAQLTATLQPGSEQEVRGGMSADVAVTSSNTAVGSIVSSPLHFTGGGAATLTALFDPQLVGTTTLSLSQPAGFTTPTTFQSILATVRAPEVRIANLNVSSNRIGRDLQLTVLVNLEDAPPEPVDVTITVAPGGEGIVSISKTRTAEGTNTVTFAGVTTTTVGTLYVQGRALGSTQLAGVAAGYNDATAAIAVDPAGFRIYGPGFATAVTTTSGAPNITVSVSSSRLDPVTLNLAAEQEVRGGLTVNIPVTSSNTGVGVITVSPIVWNGGTGATKQTLFDPLSVGTTVVSIPAPVTGFAIPSNGSSTITFTVNP